MPTQPHMAATLIKGKLIVVVVATRPRCALDPCICWDFGSRALGVVSESLLWACWKPMSDKEPVLLGKYHCCSDHSTLLTVRQY